MLEMACDHKSRDHARVHMQEEIELIVGKACLAVFCLAAFNSEEEGLEISSLCCRFGQSSYFSVLTIESYQQFAPPEPLRYLCRCEALRLGQLGRYGQSTWAWGVCECTRKVRTLISHRLETGSWSCSPSPCLTALPPSPLPTSGQGMAGGGGCSPEVPQHLSSFRAWEHLKVNQSKQSPPAKGTLGLRTVSGEVFL